MSEGPQPAPTCYRHPDRETHIRCVRCDRPICPDCMVAASVGFQCPECVRSGAATTRAPRTVFGGRTDHRDGLVTKVIIGLCLGAFVLQILIPTFTGRFALFPLGVAAGQWYRLVTAAFLHASIFHIGFNLLALWVVGPGLESVLGRARFIAVYAVSLFAGAAASYAFSAPLGYSLGASGAVFGLFGSTIVVMRRLNREVGGLVGIVVLNLLMPLFIPNIDWRAHVGGLVAGTLVTVVLVYAPRRAWAASAVAAVGVVLTLSVALVAVRSQQLRTDPVLGPLVQQVQELEQSIHGNPL